MFNVSSRPKLTWAMLCSLAIAGLGAPPALAHHGGGTFDPNRCFVFTGTVRQMAWANPHSWIYVNVAKAGGATELWGFEFGTVAGLSRAGLRPTDFKAGTKVTITAHVNRDRARHTGSSSKLVMANGRVIGGPETQGSVPGQGGSLPGGPGPGAPRKPASCPNY